MAHDGEGVLREQRDRSRAPRDRLQYPAEEQESEQAVEHNDHGQKASVKVEPADDHGTIALGRRINGKEDHNVCEHSAAEWQACEHTLELFAIDPSKRIPAQKMARPQYEAKNPWFNPATTQAERDQQARGDQAEVERAPPPD